MLSVASAASEVEAPLRALGSLFDSAFSERRWSFDCAPAALRSGWRTVTL